MALATLSVDFIAKVAQFEADLKRVARTSEQNSERMAAAFGLAKSALGGLVAGLSVGASVAFFRNIVDGVDALNDLADATGSSIENISALEDVAARTGTSTETLTSSLIKLNQSLNAAAPGSKAEQAFKALGLSVAELKKLDPAEALRSTAVALSGFADDGNKARLSQELFGKSLAVIAPLLKDLAESGRLNATVTTEQAQAAEAFNKQIFDLQKNATDAARNIAGPLVSALNQLFDAISGKGVGGGKSLSEALTIPLQTASVLGANVAFVFRGIGNEIGGIAAQAGLFLSGNFEGAKFVGEQMRKDAAKARQEFDALEQRLLSIGRVLPQADYSNEGRQRPKASLPALLRDPAAEKSAQDKRLSEYLATTRAIAEGEEQAARDTTEAWQAWEKQQLAQHKETTEAWALQWKQVFDEIDAEQERAIEEGAAFLAAQAEKANEFSTQAARNIQDALGQSLVQLFDGSFKSIGQLWVDTLKKMVAQAAAAQLNKYLFGDTFGKEGGSLGGAIGDLVGFFSSFGGARAMGGPVSAGRAYLVGERGPELMVPGSSGTVVPNGAMGGPQITYAPVFNFTDASAEQIGRIRAVARAEYTRFARQMSIQGAN